ncbi:MAG: response regulator [Sporomusaceae bacterium]|jgi:signal transduction histidine kinase/CheY-like chemotaxis protein/HPt (histidine-containing phosphotransfer) domain-containing protein|nr:response regulator [Sporomusaceae bacterium]
MAHSIFLRTIILCLLAFVVIFSLVTVTVNDLVYDHAVVSAEEKSSEFALAAARRIDAGYRNIRGIVELLAYNLGEIDPSAPNAVAKTTQMTRTLNLSNPYIGCIWFSFESGEFLPDKRFSREYLRMGNQLEPISSFADNFLDPVRQEPPWYYVPYSTGKVWLESAYIYDYGDRYGKYQIDTVSAPIKRNGKTIGVVGIDNFHEYIFHFLDEQQKENEQLLLVLTQNGDIVYSLNQDEMHKSIFDLQLENKDKLKAALNARATTSRFESKSLFLGEPAIVYLHPIYTEAASKQLYLYAELTQKSLAAEVNKVISQIIIISTTGLFFCLIILIFAVRNILKPVKKLTNHASQIADGHLDINLESDFGAVDETKKSPNEMDTLFLALKKMLSQLNQVQTLKLEAVEARYEKEKAEASARAKSNFLARMSHEIRTPMNAIIGMGELALREDMSKAAREHVLAIKQAGANLLSIINDILDFSKIETGKLEITPVEYDMASLINDVVSIIRTRIIDSQLRFTVNIDSSIPNFLFGDVVRVRQVLLNILNNAAKYTDKGFVALAMYAEIKNDTDLDLFVEVSDSGKGIKEEHWEKLFANFTRIDDEGQNKGIEGTGLGLSITKSILTAMGGDVTLYSKYGKGSVFTVKLPQKYLGSEKMAAIKNPWEKNTLVYERRRIYANSLICTLDNMGVYCTLVETDAELAEKLAEEDYAFILISSVLLSGVKKICAEFNSRAKIVLIKEFGDPYSNPDHGSLAMPVYSLPMANLLNGVADSFTYNESREQIIRFVAPTARVLVVDDIPTNLKVAEGLMRPYGMRIDVCRSGADSIEAVKENEYDLVFMDHMMPEMDGIEATAKIRELIQEKPEIKTLPIIALTANAVSGMREMFLQNGLDDFLSKPIDTVKLNSILEKWIPKHKQQKAPPPLTRASSFKEEENKPQIEGLDVSKGIAMTGGTIKNYVQTLKIFHKDGFEKIKEIKASLAEKNLPVYVIYVHALKSSLASIGAGEISEMAKTLEIAGKHNEWNFIHENNGKFLTDLTAVLEAIGNCEAVFGEQETPQLENNQVLKDELLKLKTAVDAFDSVAIDEAVSALQSFNLPEEVSGKVETILQNTLIGEYEETISLIETLLTEVE